METSENSQKPTKECSTCNITKSIDNFYTKRNITWNHCKECEKIKRKELWYCLTCDRDYLKRDKTKHQRSKIHNHCVKYNVRNSNSLPPQCQRKDEKILNKPIVENHLVSDSEDVEITDEIKMKILSIIDPSVIGKASFVNSNF
jgi:hypothetical protein